MEEVEDWAEEQLKLIEMQQALCEHEWDWDLNSYEACVKCGIDGNIFFETVKRYTDEGELWQHYVTRRETPLRRDGNENV